MKRFPLILIVALVATAAGWFLRGVYPASGIRRPASAPAKAAPLFYQSPMHPWIKSDQPGKCTICGMDLVPVYEGDAGLNAGDGLVQLSTNTVQAIHVATEEAALRPLTRTLRFSGNIEDDDSRHRILSAYVPGRVDRLFVNYIGAEVTEGQTLATFYSPMLLASVREYLALQKHPADSADLVVSARLRLRQFGLTDAQIDDLTKNFQESDIHVSLLAPMTGTVVARDVYEGQYVKEGDRLFELADFSTMWFQFDAYERDLAWLRPGQSVEVTTASKPGRTFTGKIAFIDPTFSMMTRSTKVRVELPNPLVGDGETKHRELSHRLFAEARVTAAAQEPVLTIARTAVINPDGSPLVYVEKSLGVYEPRRVALGRSGDGLVEVTKGLDAGDRVVTTGNMLIDAQAQLNGGSRTGSDRPPHPSSEHPLPLGGEGRGEGAHLTLSGDQRSLLDKLFSAGAALGSALAADDLGQFNEQTHVLHSLAPTVAKAFADHPDLKDLAESVNRTAHWPEPDSLESARARFNAFITPVTQLAEIARAQKSAPPSLKIYQCPMTKNAFPKAPATARWLQLEGTIHNPYFGAAMLDCGTEVR
jgi:Cu(I)/Ag(I) efflux system membrane fusion protein